MSNNSDKPFWWSAVKKAGINSDQWEPVREGNITKTGEMSLLSQGWANTDSELSTIGRVYSRYDPPRIRRKKVNMVTWRLCANVGGSRASRRPLKWIQSEQILMPWCALEAQTNPFETVKTLPDGEEPTDPLVATVRSSAGRWTVEGGHNENKPTTTN